MEALKTAIQEQGIRYILKGDVYLPDLELPEESRPIGRWGRLHKSGVALSSSRWPRPRASPRS